MPSILLDFYLTIYVQTYDYSAWINLQNFS